MWKVAKLSSLQVTKILWGDLKNATTSETDWGISFKGG